MVPGWSAGVLERVGWRKTRVLCLVLGRLCTAIKFLLKAYSGLRLFATILSLHFTFGLHIESPETTSSGVCVQGSGPL